MFSANVQGSLPGIDIAFLLGAAAYHTTQDSYENIRRGTLQVGLLANRLQDIQQLLVWTLPQTVVQVSRRFE